MRLRLLLALFVLLGLSVVGIALVNAQTVTPSPTLTPNPPSSQVIRPDIYVRAGPDESFLPVGRLIEGAPLFPVSRNETADWVMIRYSFGFGWIRRDLGFWLEDIDDLPVMSSKDLTPTNVPGRESATPFFPTSTPEGNWVNVLEAEGAFVRAGPGRTFLRLDTLMTGYVIEEPLGRNADTTWIMFRYEDDFGWISQNIVRWVDDLEMLPVVSPDNLTPSATFTATNTPTVTATATLTATLTATASPTATATVTPSPTETETPTLTPTFTATVTLTDTPSATPTVTSTHTATLTSTATSTDVPSPTPTLTATLTETPSPTATATLTDTDIPSETPTLTATVTLTATPSVTLTETATVTATDFPTSTDTSQPSATSTLTPTWTATVTAIPPTTVTAIAQALVASETASTVPPSSTPIPSFTPQPSATHTPQPTSTETATPTSTVTETATAMPTSSVTFTPTATVTQTESLTPTLAATSTVVSASETSVAPSETPTLTATTVAAVIVEPTEISPTATLVPQVELPPEGGRFPIEAIVGLILLGLILGYVALYVRGAAAADRYANGFVVDICPVCQQGHLVVETKQDRWLGIPRPRRTLRCTHCRSVLRETGDYHWRYAVDPVENAAIYQRYNGQEIDDETLIALAAHLPEMPDDPQARPSVIPPSFVDDEDS